MNQCHFLGRLTRDPELKAFGDNKRVVNFSIAINRPYKKNGEWVDETAFLDCEAWDTGADLIDKYYRKKDLIIVHGGLKQDNWEDKNSGQKRSKLKLRVERFEFVPKNEGTSGGYTDGGGEGEAEAEPTKAKATKAPKRQPEPVAVDSGVGEDDGSSIPF